MGLKAHPRAPPLSPPLGRTPWGGNPRGGAAPPSPLYIVEVWAAQDTRERLSFGAALPLSLLLLSRGAWRSRAGLPRSSITTRRRAAAGWSLPQPLLLPLLDQGVGDVTGLHVC